MPGRARRQHLESRRFATRRANVPSFPGGAPPTIPGPVSSSLPAVALVSRAFILVVPPCCGGGLEVFGGVLEVVPAGVWCSTPGRAVDLG